MARSRKQQRGRLRSEQVARRLRNDIEGVVSAYLKKAAAKATKVVRRDSRTLREATDDFHRTFVLQALEDRRMGTRWNISATAADLEIARSYLYGLIESLDLPKHYAQSSPARRSKKRAARSRR